MSAPRSSRRPLSDAGVPSRHTGYPPRHVKVAGSPSLGSSRPRRRRGRLPAGEPLPWTWPTASTATSRMEPWWPLSSVRCSSRPPRRLRWPPSLVTRRRRVPAHVGLIVRPGRSLAALIDAVENPAARTSPARRERRDRLVAGLRPSASASSRSRWTRGGPTAGWTRSPTQAPARRRRLKFRTGETSTAVAGRGAAGRLPPRAVARGLAFKLTGGLHHVVRGDDGGEPMHGLLNVLVATQARSREPGPRSRASSRVPTSSTSSAG